MNIIARRRRGESKWHYCQNCSDWPQSDYETSASPSSSEVCWQCHTFDRAGGCLYQANENGEDKPGEG